MFLLYLILFLGSIYIYHRFNSVSDKSAFYKSVFFSSIAGSVGILVSVIIIINLFSTASPTLAKKETTIDSLQIDTTYASLMTRKPDYHYLLAALIVDDFAYFHDLEKIEQHYKEYINTGNKNLISIGDFGLGVLALQQKKYDVALRYFKHAPDQKLPYLHFCEGEAYRGKDSLKLAVDHYKAELKIAEGNFNESFLILVEQYKTDKNYEGLKELMAYNVSSDLFSDDLARTTVLFNGDLLQYVYWTVATINHKTKLAGLIAALAILLTWFYYLYKLDIYNRSKLLSHVLMFASGVLCIILIIVFNDVHDELYKWSLQGTFFNDLIYSVVMIGMPEEFVKILPLFVLLAFKRSLKEPIDYITYGSASALGFAFIENLLYFQDVTRGIIHGRAYFAVISHMVDSSFIAYGFVLSRFKYKELNSSFMFIPISFLAGSFAHGFYDFLLFHGLIFIFYLFFILIIQIWIIIINNCLNNSPRFSYRYAYRAERSRLIMTLALTAILALEYLMVGFSEGAELANYELIVNISFAGFLIIFFSSNLSSFNLIRGYWRDVYFSSREKRGYGTLPAANLMSSWYLVNAIRAHNYVGMRVRLWNDPFNLILSEVMDGHYEGTILDRIILYERGEADPHWFIIKLDTPIPFAEDSKRYVLVKLRYQNNSLVYEDEVQVFFKAIPDIKLLKTKHPAKEKFPFYGWAYISKPLNQNVMHNG